MTRRGKPEHRGDDRGRHRVGGCDRDDAQRDELRDRRRLAERVGARELVLVPLIAVYLARRRPHAPLRADRLGKLATVAQFIALCVIALAPDHALPAAAVAGGIGLVAAGHYVATATHRDDRIADGGRDTPQS